jgi:beta-glucosidase
MGRIDLLQPDKSDFYWATGIEDTFIAQTEIGKRALDEYELMQHYWHWKEDIDLAADLGVQMLRYGIPWYKVNPRPGVYAWTWVDQVIRYMVEEKKIEPIIDLMHYGTPTWLENQFIHPDYPKYVTEYAVEFANRYHSLVRYYTPLNEPFVNAEFCGRIKRWPPYLEGDSGFLLVMKNISMGIIETVNGIRSIDPDSIMVHVEATGLTVTDDPSLHTEAEQSLHKRLTQLDLITGRVDKEHPLYDWFLKNGVKSEELEWFREHAITIDVMGLNYYPELSVSELYKENGIVKSKMVWGGESCLETILKFYYERYRRPIFITETSTNQKVGDRVKWLNDSIHAVKKLRAQDVPIVGYTWFPLYDLINWDYREGKEPVEFYLEPMGLWKLEMGFDRVFKRIPTEAAEAYKQIIHSVPI